jgi:pilus assembly protein CpaE
MFRSVIVCGDHDLARRLQHALADSGRVGVLRTVDQYPELVELTRLLRAAAPEIVFLSTESMLRAAELVKQIESNAPGIQIVAISRTSDTEMILESMRAGIREFIPMPFAPQQLQETLQRVERGLSDRAPSFQTSDLLYSFLPSKAGVGTSTIALNLAVAMSRIPETSVVLSDFDLSSGMLRFMLKLDNDYSISDAAEHAAEMDEELWPQLVTAIGSMDVLHAGKLNPGLRIEPAQVRYLIDFMRRNYKALCCDLSGNMEKYSLEIMNESKRIFLICTPEIPSLHLAREKYSFLKSLGMEERVSIVLNRVLKRPVITSQHVEEILGLPVAVSLPNDYAGVHQALTAGRAIDPNTELGRGFTALAQSLVAKRPAPAAVSTKKRFIEYFSIMPSRAS